MESQQDAGHRQLIEGDVGPFYVALNQAAFYLLAVIFAALVPLVAWLLRDASMPLQVLVAGGSALEAGAIAHIYVQRVRGRSPALGWSVHAVVAALVAAALFAALAV